MKQLDQFNVPDDVLAAPGARLVDLIGEQGVGSVDDMLGPPPPDGWRVVAGSLAAPESDLPTLAAPWINRDPSKWMLISLNRRDGQWHSIIQGTGSVVRPGRDVRRAGLALDWVVSPMTAPVGTVPTLKLALRNVGPAPWHNEGEDYDDVRVWALGPAGERLLVEHSAWGMAAVEVHLLPSVNPGAAVQLTATWQPESVEKLPPGVYALEAQLQSLELPCSPGTLRLG